jgi:Macrocin-O-methyltransferase (TylF)
MMSFLLPAIALVLLAWPAARWLNEVRLRKIAQKRHRIACAVTQMEKLAAGGEIRAGEPPFDPLFGVMVKAQLSAELPLPQPGRPLEPAALRAAGILAAELAGQGPASRILRDFARAYHSALFYSNPLGALRLRGAPLPAGLPALDARNSLVVLSVAELMRPQHGEAGNRLDKDVLAALDEHTRWLQTPVVRRDAEQLRPSRDAHLELFKDVLSGAVYEESAWTLVQWEVREPGEGLLSRVWTGLENRVIDAFSRRLARRDIVLTHMRPYQEDVRLRGKDWPLVGYSMIGRKRMDNLQACVETVLRDGVAGDLIETGVWRGGAVMLMKAILKANGVTDRTVWIADSFAGLPKPDSKSDGADYSQNKFLAVSRNRVEANFRRFGLMDDRVRFLEGWFCDTLPGAPIDKLAVLRLDGDLYSSTMDALVSLYPKVNKGGFVIVDDYFGWPGCNRAIHEYLLSRGESPAIQAIDEDAAYWRVS